MGRGRLHAWIALLLLAQQVCGIGVLRVHPFCPGAMPCEAAAVPAVEASSACCRRSDCSSEAVGACVRRLPAAAEGCIGLALDGASGCTPCCRYTMGLGAAVMPALGSGKQPAAPDEPSAMLPPVPFQLAAIAHAALRPHAPAAPAFVEGRVRRATMCVRTI